LQSEVEAGAVLLGVHVAGLDVPRIRQVLTDAGATDIEVASLSS
jgi:hypothetical protein